MNANYVLFSKVSFINAKRVIKSLAAFHIIQQQYAMCAGFMS